jgi:NADH-quinone oxidoreductase subunit J
MSGYDLAFYAFSFLTLLCGVLVILNRNPVTSAMCLVLTIVSMAGLFVLLRAFFLAAVQILVYAGAVMVLFLFVIMLLDLKEETRRKMNKLRAAAALLAVFAVMAIVLNVIWSALPGTGLPAATLTGATAPLGRLLFQNFLLPFEILSLLLLVAMLGVILLSKKDLR